MGIELADLLRDGAWMTGLLAERARWEASSRSELRDRRPPGVEPPIWCHARAVRHYRQSFQASVPRGTQTPQGGRRRADKRYYLNQAIQYYKQGMMLDLNEY
jgi:hypothetical protein